MISLTIALVRLGRGDEKLQGLQASKKGKLHTIK